MDLAKKYSRVITADPGFVQEGRTGSLPWGSGAVSGVTKEGRSVLWLGSKPKLYLLSRAKAKQGFYKPHLTIPQENPPAFYILYFSVSSITISMCGGCWEVLLKLALLHPRHGQGGHASRKGSGKPVAAVTWRKQPAQLATCSINLCRLQRRSPASAKYTRRKL